MWEVLRVKVVPAGTEGEVGRSGGHCGRMTWGCQYEIESSRCLGLE